MKKTVSIFLSLILPAFLLVSCSPGGDPGTSPSVPTQSDAGSAPDPEADASETEAPAVPDFAAKLTDHSWFIANPSAVGAMTFEGSEASFLLFENGEDKSVSGPVTFAEKSLTIGGEEFGWAVVASFCKLTRGDISYSLTKTDDADAARGPYNLLTNRWSGDGLMLSFDGGNATLEIDGGVRFSGSYELTAGKTLVIHDDAAGGSDVNLALGAKASSSSVETPDFPPEYAVDGDLGTRFSSEYVDPSWLTLDLGFHLRRVDRRGELDRSRVRRGQRSGRRGFSRHREIPRTPHRPLRPIQRALPGDGLGAFDLGTRAGRRDPRRGGMRSGIRRRTGRIEDGREDLHPLEISGKRAAGPFENSAALL